MLAIWLSVPVMIKFFPPVTLSEDSSKEKPGEIKMKMIAILNAMENVSPRHILLIHSDLFRIFYSSGRTSSGDLDIFFNGI